MGGSYLGCGWLALNKYHKTPIFIHDFYFQHVQKKFTCSFDVGSNPTQPEMLIAQMDRANVSKCL